MADVAAEKESGKRGPGGRPFKLERVVREVPDESAARPVMPSVEENATRDAVQVKIAPVDTSPLNVIQGAGAAAGASAGDAIVSSMLASVRAGIGAVKAAIEQGLAGTTANVNVKVGGGNAANSDASPAPSRSN